MAEPEPPYRVDQRAVRFELSGDSVRVHSTTVKTIDRIGLREWEVTDAQGNLHVVNRQGEGATLVPLDAELRQQLATKGEGFQVVESGRRLLEPPPIQPLEKQFRRERGIGGRDGIS